MLNHRGRIKIYTDVEAITYDNVVDVVRDAFSEHMVNVADINFLLGYDAGDQPLLREKTYRPDIDCQCVDNVAHQVTEFELGFDWSNPITLVQRGNKDSGSKKGNDGENETLGISLLNECYEAEGNKSKTQENARFLEICGLGYTYVETKKVSEWEDGESYFSLSVLDPRSTFLVYSSYYIDKRPMLGVTYRHDSRTGNNYFTCFSVDRRYEIINLQEVVNGKYIEEENRWIHNRQMRSGEKNPLGKIPIIEWIRSHDRTGAWEHQIDEMDNLNLMISDFSNDVEQNMNCVWHSNDVEFPTEIITNEDGTKTEKVKKPKSGEWVQTFTTQDGKTPIIEGLAINYDYDGMLSNIQYARERILEKCNVPSRNDNSGGSTGVAMDSATGYAAAESAANKKQMIIETCKMKEVDVVLSAIRNSSIIEPDNPMLSLRRVDMQPSIKRQRNYEMSVKTTSLANLLSHGVYGLHAFQTVNLFEDVSQVWEDSRELVTKYQESLFATSSEKEEEPKTADGGREAQIGNSPLIDGLKFEQPKDTDK